MEAEILTAPVEVKPNELTLLIDNSGVEQSTAKTLRESFMPFFEKAEDWKKKAESLVVTNVEQKREMQEARVARLALRDIRIQADKTRKQLKEDSLRYGKAVQGVYNVIEYLIAPIEEHLEKQEKFAEIQEANRRAALKDLRENEIRPLAEFVPHGLDFGAMPDEDYAKLLNGAKLQQEQKAEEERRAEQERIEAARIEKLTNERRNAVAPYSAFIGEGECHPSAFGVLTEEAFNEILSTLQQRKADHEAEQERIRLENERLKAEAEAAANKLAEERAAAERARQEAEAKARKEREEAEARLKAEREATAVKLREQEAENARIAAELKAKQEAEAEAERARIAADKKAKSAPDKAKLSELANRIDAFMLPEVKSEEAATILHNVRDLLAKTSMYLRGRIELL